MKHLTVIALTLIAVCFQNFSVLNIALNDKYSVSEYLRRQHAEEILGSKHFKASYAALVDNNELLNIQLLNLVHNSVPAKHQKSAEKIAKAILAESKKHGIDPVFIASIIKTESSFNPSAKGSAGEIGLMQIKPKTAEYIAKKFNIPFAGEKTLYNPEKNIRIGAAYLNYLRGKFENKPKRYISAYNSGPGTIRRVKHDNKLPDIYSGKVLRFYEDFYKKIYFTQAQSTVIRA